MNKLVSHALTGMAIVMVAGSAAIATATALPLVATAAPAPAPVPAPKPSPVAATPTTPTAVPAPVPVPTTPTAAPAPAIPSTGANKAAPTIENCASASQAEPRQVTLFCADANDTLTKLHWRRWGEASAQGSATDVINLCQPSCVAGRNHDYRVAVTVSDLQSDRAGRRYERLTVTFAGKPPKGTSRVEHFKLGAHGPEIG